MNRDWLTLAFGLVLVATVVVLSLRHNMQSRASAPEPASESRPDATPTVHPATSAIVPAAPTPAAPGNAPPATATPRAKEHAAAAAAPAASAAPPQPDVTLEVHSDVAGASVFVDRQFVGTTPLTVRGLTPGGKQLNVTATGYEGYAAAIDLGAGSNRVNVEFNKVRLNASLPVVHRHAMGSCQGTLAATPKGLTYDTADKDDAFVLAFADLDEFEMDYLKKNLRVRRRAGKTWNFTNASADALLVFHKDVSKARERLAAAR